MEKTKYISANDFFPINYAMLFNVRHTHTNTVMIACHSNDIAFGILLLPQMAAAIVTHMLVLLQFQQWEDNQNILLDDDDSGNPTTVTPT